MPEPASNPTQAQETCPDGVLHVKMLWSPHPHARIRSLDVREAEAVEGVRCILSCENVHSASRADGSPTDAGTGLQDGRAFDREVCFVGDRVAAVAAITPEIAQEALERIRVEYDLLPPVLELSRAIEADSPPARSAPPLPGDRSPLPNLASHRVEQIGSPDEALARAETVIDAEYRVPPLHTTPLAPHAATAWIDADGCLVVRTATATPHHVQQALASLLGLPAEQIRVVRVPQGMGFAAIHGSLVEDVPALVAWRTRCPARLEIGLAEDFPSSRIRQAQVLRVRIGAHPDGTLAAMDLRVIANTGARAPLEPTDGGLQALSLYDCPHVRFESSLFYTNLPVAGGTQDTDLLQASFAVECAMDEMAHRLAMDPVEFRRLNVAGRRAVPESPGEAASSERDAAAESLGRCLDLGAHSIGWWGRAFGGQRIRLGSAAHMRRGIGVACVRRGPTWTDLASGRSGPADGTQDEGLQVAQFAEVEVDLETGRVHLLRFVTALECGQPAQVALCEGEMDGGATMGMGAALCEGLHFNDQGHLLNPDLRDYRIFSSMDVPDAQSLLVAPAVERPAREGLPVSEVSLAGPAPAIANAVHDAVGLRIREIPLTPERVWRALRERGLT